MMIKYNKENFIFYSIISFLIIMACIGLFTYRIITPACYIILIIYWGYHDLKHRHLSNPNPKEIKILREELENKEVKEYIRDCFFNKGLGIRKIGKKLENEFSIELFISKGVKAGDYKSESIFETLYEILGFNTATAF